MEKKLLKFYCGTFFLLLPGKLGYKSKGQSYMLTWDLLTVPRKTKKIVKGASRKKAERQLSTLCEDYTKVSDRGDFWLGYKYKIILEKPSCSSAEELLALI